VIRYTRGVQGALVIAAGADTAWAAVSDGSLEVLSLATDGIARVVALIAPADIIY
jgi:hypothetical protein